MILMPDDTFEPGIIEFGIGSISDNINPNLYQNQTHNPPAELNTIIFDCECCECIWKDGKVLRVTIGPCDAGIFFYPGNSTKH